MSAPAIGIDLGTTYSCVGVFQHGKFEIIANDQGNRTTPSCVTFTDTGRLIGEAAKEQETDNLRNMVFDAKRMIGRRFEDPAVQAGMRHWPFDLVGDSDGRPKIKVDHKGDANSFFPEEISSMVLAKLKEAAEAYLGVKVANAVVAVPAYFDGSQRQATKEACAMAGLNILRIVDDPVAAAVAYVSEPAAVAVAYVQGKDGPVKRNVLVFDLGGVAFHVSVLTIAGGDVNVKATAGDTRLGGEDFDNRMVDHFVTQFKEKHNKDLSSSKWALSRLRTACERAKRTLSFSTQASIVIYSLFEGIDFYSIITRDRFEELNSDLFSRILEPTEKALRGAKMDKTEIHDIFLVGGSTRILKVQRLLQDFFIGKKLTRSINPDEVVAYGAAIVAARLNRNRSEQVNDYLLVGVAPLTLGVNLLGGDMMVFIERNSVIPTRRTNTVFTTLDNQTGITFNIYEGERAMAKDNNKIGNITLTGVPPALRFVVEIEVTFDLDAGGILNVSVFEKTTGNGKRTTIGIGRGRLSGEEIEKVVEDAEKHRDEDKKQRNRVAHRNSLESYALAVRRKVENDELKGKIPKSNRKLVLHKVKDTLKWLDRNPLAEIERLDAHQKELENVYNPVITKLGQPAGDCPAETSHDRRFPWNHWF